MTTIAEDRYLTLLALVAYSGLSLSTLKRALKGEHPMPHARVGGRVLVKQSAFDQWVDEQAVVLPTAAPQPVHAADVAQIVRSIKGR